MPVEGLCFRGQCRRGRAVSVVHAGTRETAVFGSSRFPHAGVGGALLSPFLPKHLRFEAKGHASLRVTTLAGTSTRYGIPTHVQYRYWCISRTYLCLLGCASSESALPPPRPARELSSRAPLRHAAARCSARPAAVSASRLARFCAASRRPSSASVLFVTPTHLRTHAHTHAPLHTRAHTQQCCVNHVFHRLPRAVSARRPPLRALPVLLRGGRPSCGASSCQRLSERSHVGDHTCPPSSQKAPAV